MSVTILFGILNLVIFHEIVTTFQTGWILSVRDVEHTIPVLILVGSALKIPIPGIMKALQIVMVFLHSTHAVYVMVETGFVNLI